MFDVFSELTLWGKLTFRSVDFLEVDHFPNIVLPLSLMRKPASRVENSAQVLSCQLKFAWSIQGTLTEGGRLSAVDLLVITTLDQLNFILKILFIFLQKQATFLGGPLY